MILLTDVTVISQPIVEDESVTVISTDNDLVIDAPITVTNGDLYFLARNIYLTNNAVINGERDITFQTTQNFIAGGSTIESGRNFTVDSNKEVVIHTNVRDVLMNEIRSTVTKIS